MCSGWRSVPRPARELSDGHVAVAFVDAARIAELNRSHRDRPAPTDVLSFPVDGADPCRGRSRSARAQRPLGAASSATCVICPEHTVDLREAVVHGVLHLVGMDHETDDGEMLALQASCWPRTAR